MQVQDSFFNGDVSDEEGVGFGVVVGVGFDVGCCGAARGRWLLALGAFFAGRAATMEHLIPSPSAFWKY
ncbi:MAG: hypothetical protein AAGC93_07985 [Cyanobacteria bacterium P01_F01_bin.53]